MQNNTPHVIYSKPYSHIGVPDWKSRILQNIQTSDTRRDDAFNLRYEGRKLIDEKNIQTEWNTYRSDSFLDERVNEIEKWKQLLEFCLDSTTKELSDLINEKSITERTLDSLDNPLGVILECISIRDQRRQKELTNDEVEEGLKKELCTIQQMRKLLSDHCQIAWEKIISLKDLIFKLNVDLTNKQQALSVDIHQLKLDRNCAEITLKIDPLAVVKRSVTHDSWIRNLEILKEMVEDHLTHSRKIRSDLFAARERAKNSILEEHDILEFHLRKRIFLSEKMRNEIHWNQQKMAEELNKVAEKIKALEYALHDKLDPTRLVETRLENRSLRPGSEVTSDDPENNLKEELIELRSAKKELINKIVLARTTYSTLEEQKILIDNDLEDKNHTLDVDTKCFDTRSRLRASIITS